MGLAGLARWVILLAALLAAVCDGKVWKGSARLSPSKPWVPLTSFAFDKGTGQVCI